jgi:uncharacterized protein
MGRRISLRIVATTTALLLLLGATGYAVGGYLAFQQLSVVHPACGSRSFARDTPATFILPASESREPVELDRYHFSGPEDVAFPARGDPVTIRAWFAPPRSTGGPVVVIVHGYDSCRRDWNVLLPAGMLHSAGFGVLLLDLRNHGDSDPDDGRWAGGSKEYRDVLGAWDWLRSRGYDAHAIGLFGVSMGAATATIATGEEPAVAATWADSSYDRYAVAAEEYAEVKGYPGWVAGAAVPVGRALGESELAVRDPGTEVRRLAGRPFYVVHGLADTLIMPHNAVELAVDAAAGGTPVDPWLVAGAEHTHAMLVEPRTYADRLVGFFAGALGTP